MTKKVKLWMVKRITHIDHPGYTVRVGEYRANGPLNFFYWCKDAQKAKSQVLTPRTYRVDLGEGTKEQEREAIKLGREFIKTLGARDLVPMGERRTPLTFRELYDAYAANALTACKFADAKDAVPGGDFCVPYQCKRKHVTPGYRKETLGRILTLATFFGLHKPVADLKTVDVKRWIDRRLAQGHAASLRADLVALSAACRWAVEDAEILPKNPLLKARKEWRGLSNPRREIYTEAQYRELLTVADQVQSPFKTHSKGEESPQSVAAREAARAFPVLLTVAWESGRRLGAILRLKWDDVQLTSSKGAPFGRVTWYAGAPPGHKKRREQTLKMRPALHAALLRWRKDAPKSVSGYVFPSPRLAGKPIETSLAKRWLNSAEELAGIEHLPHRGWHGFRRGAVSHLSSLGHSLAVIAEYVGHSDQSTTMRSYNRPLPEGLDAICSLAS
jgi:integrase